MVYLFYVHCLVYLLGTTSTCSCKNKIVNGRDLMRMKKWLGDTYSWQTKSTRWKRVHEITSTNIGVGYLMYWHFNWFLHKYKGSNSELWTHYIFLIICSGNFVVYSPVRLKWGIVQTHEMTWLCNSHGYEVNSAATDSSSRNEIGERPLRTLKERMRYVYDVFSKIGYIILGQCTNACSMVI